MYNNKRLMLSIFWIVLGVVLIALSIMEKLDSSTYSAMGGVLIAIGALQTIRKWKQYEHNRDAYTDAKTDFISKRTAEARKEYGDRY